MIDAERLIYTEIEEKVRNEFPKAFITGEEVSAPPSFPCVSLIEIDNATFRNTQSTEGQENHIEVSYELNVYSNKTVGKKTECRKIINFVDRLLMNRNFTRMMLNPVSNMNDSTIYRMIGRYRAVISRDYTIFRR